MSHQAIDNSGIAQRGAALVAAIFMLLVVTGTGAALLFLAQNEIKMSGSAVRLKQAFYLAEGGLEHARAELHNGNTDDDFDDELQGVSVDGTIDFVADSLTVTWDSNGVPTGLAGFNDDTPFVPLTALGDAGWYAAFLTNDPLEDPADPDDSNKRVTLVGVGLGADRSMEVVEAIVNFEDLLPSAPPATITMLGPSPNFDGGHANPHEFSGDDCGGLGDPSIHVPVVGTIGASAEADSEDGIHGGPDFESGGYTDEDTFADLTDAANEPTLVADIAPQWLDCQYVKGIVERARDFADLVCGDGCNVEGRPAGDLILVDGDADIGPAGGAGTLIVTGELTYDGRASWHGMILVFGEGIFLRNGGGNGIISGATMVADIAGPDDTYGTPDDCTGGDGGFDSASWEMNGGGSADTNFCMADIIASKPRPPYEVQAFRQH